MDLGIVPDEGYYPGHIIKGQCMHWKPSSVAIHPGYKTVLTATGLDVEELFFASVVKEEEDT